MRKPIIEFWVGVFVLIGFAAFMFLALKVGDLQIGRQGATYSVTAPFTNIGGLNVRAAVRAAGVNVGRVTRIDFDNDTYEAIVTLTIDAQYAFPADSSVSILTSGVLGENYIGIDAGGDFAMLEDGDSITLTQSAVVLERLISEFLYNTAQQGE